jgi:hypothetical protein
MVARNAFVFAMLYFHWTRDLRMKEADEEMENEEEFPEVN